MLRDRNALENFINGLGQHNNTSAPNPVLYAQQQHLVEKCVINYAKEIAYIRFRDASAGVRVYNYLTRCSAPAHGAAVSASLKMLWLHHDIADERMDALLEDPDNKPPTAAEIKNRQKRERAGGEHLQLTCCELLSMFGDPADEERRAEAADWVEDLKEDLREQIEKLGVVKICVDTRESDQLNSSTAPAGRVIVQFESPEGAEKARSILDMRLYDGRTIKCSIISLAEFQEKLSQMPLRR